MARRKGLMETEGFTHLPRGNTSIVKNQHKGRQSRKDDLRMVGPGLPDKPSRPVGKKSDLGTREPEAPRKHPLALSGGRHPPDRPDAPKFSRSAPTKNESSTSSDTPTSPSKTPQTATAAKPATKAPSSGTMSYTPENPTQRASVTSGEDTRSKNIISGTEAVRRAGDKAAQQKMERLLWGLHGSDR